jgi:hypothetical protein
MNINVGKTNRASWTQTKVTQLPLTDLLPMLSERSFTDGWHRSVVPCDYQKTFQEILDKGNIGICKVKAVSDVTGTHTILLNKRAELKMLCCIFKPGAHGFTPIDLSLTLDDASKYIIKAVDCISSDGIERIGKQLVEANAPQEIHDDARVIVYRVSALWSLVELVQYQKQDPDKQIQQIKAL